MWGKIMKEMIFNYDLPPIFDEHEEQQDDDNKGACETFIIMDSP